MGAKYEYFVLLGRICGKGLEGLGWEKYFAELSMSK